jgi:FAD/FMN-containing dehydrogenase
MSGVLVNDIHSQLNATRVARVIEPASLDAIRSTVRAARDSGASLSVCGGRHAMGGQQFGTDTWLLDQRQHRGIRAFDRERGLITVDSGIQWPDLIEGYLALQADGKGGPMWGIRQKQTGADRLTLGGALSANIHGRGLRLPPIISDVESFLLVDANGDVRHCSRSENAKWFALAIGGYGLFGVIAEITLRLMPRLKVERRTEVLSLDELVRVPEERDTNDWLFGDFQFAIDEQSPEFLRRGVFSAYCRLHDDAPLPEQQRHLSPAQWGRLLHLAHTDRARAFAEYANHYRATHGQRYWSDTHQLSTYLDNYHAAIDAHLGCRATEMISELYVPRATLTAFMTKAAELLRAGRAPVIYGTIRLIERDEESFLAWAREPWACIIFNLHVVHTPAGLAQAEAAFRGLIDLALANGGSFFLTYHRWATREQIEAAHPRFREFLRHKEALDPTGLFTSDWYRHHRALFGSRAALAK